MDIRSIVDFAQEILEMDYIIRLLKEENESLRNELKKSKEMTEYLHNGNVGIFNAVLDHSLKDIKIE